MIGMDKKDKLKSKPSSSPGFSDNNSNYSIPTFKIKNENGSATDGDKRTGHSDENEPSTSKDKDETKDSSQHLTVPYKDNRPRRASSLKIGKASSEEETSSDKKIVRFADAFGLDLVDVKVFVNDGSLPNIPLQAFSDLKITNKKPLSPRRHSMIQLTVDKYVLSPQFEQPGSDPNFINRVRDQKVCLENVVTLDLQVTGIVRISNLHYEKVVLVRYTMDNWNSEHEHSARYVVGSTDTVTDKFTFTLYPRHMKPGDKLTFVVKYEVLGQVFWDNNYSKDYTLLCSEKNKSCPHRNLQSQQSV